MSYKKTILIISLPVLLVIFAVGYFVTIDRGNKNYPKEETRPEWKINLRLKLQQDVREKMSEGYPRGYLNDELDNIVAAIYLPNFLLQEQVSDINELNHPEEKEWKKQVRGGVIVFQIKNEEIQQIWESQEVMGQPFGRAELKDLDNDGSDELLVWWSNGKSYWLWIYKWLDSSFILISPFEEIIDQDGKKRKRFVFAEKNIEVIDLDGDKIYEVRLPYSKIIKFLPDENGYEIIPVKENYIRTYKWDTEKQEYYPWQEEKIEEDIDL